MHPAALYARTSQEHDDAFSLDSQIAECLTYAEENNLRVPAEYILREEFTGKVLDRPELNKLRKLMHTRTIDAVIVFDASRFARTIGVADLLLDEIFETGVELHLVSWGTAVKDSIRDRKTFYDESVYADIERRKIIERTSRGKRNKQAQGIWLGQGLTKYGFRKTGQKRETRLHINEDEATVIRSIFHAFAVEGARPGIISDMLTDQGIPTPSQATGSWKAKAHWTEEMIYSTLRDEAYIGRFYFNKWETRATPRGTRSKILRPRSEWQLVEFPHLRMIDQEIWEMAQDLLDQGRKLHAPAPKREYLLSRKLRCPMCQRSVSCITSIRTDHELSYYVCEGRRSAQSTFKRQEKRDKCRVPYIQVAKLDRIFWDWVCALGNNPEAVLTGYQRIQRLQLEEQHDGLINVEGAQRIVERYERELGEEYEEYRAGMITKKIYLERKEQMDKRLTEARATLAEYQTTLQSRVLTEHEIRERAQQVTQIASAARSLNSLGFTQRRTILDILNITGRIGLQSDRPYVEIVWCGEPQSKLWIDEDSDGGENVVGEESQTSRYTPAR